MGNPKLVYFDIDGARGEAARLAMVIGKVAFEDDRVKFADWPGLKASTPFGALPVLEVDGQAVAQSNTINRYVGKLTGLYPNDAWQAALCDETMDAVEEIATRLWSTMALPEGEKKSQRESLAAGPLTHSRPSSATPRRAWWPVLRRWPSHRRGPESLRLDSPSPVRAA
jgi:glutathione S-transferase